MPRDAAPVARGAPIRSRGASPSNMPEEQAPMALQSPPLQKLHPSGEEAELDPAKL